MRVDELKNRAIRGIADAFLDYNGRSQHGAS